jgi:DNA-binding MarR family transcriptional regulator
MRAQAEQRLAWRVLGRFHRTMHAHRQLMTKMLAERDIHPGQAICLRELAHNDGVTQRDLAELMCVSRPTVTVMLQKMERAGLVERTADAADQRFTRIRLTETGWRVHEEMHRVLDQFATETLGQLGEDDQREFERLLGLFGDRLDAALGDAG